MTIQNNNLKKLRPTRTRDKKMLQFSYTNRAMVLITAVLMAGSVMAQGTYTNLAGNEVRIGIQGGLNFSDYWGGDSPESKTKPGIRLGVVTEYRDSKFRNVSVQTGLLFVQQGSEIESFMGERIHAVMTLNYLKVPINFRYNFDLGAGMGIFVQAGIYAGFALTGKQKTEEDGVWESEKINFSERNMERFDTGLGLGAGIQVMNRMQLCFGYDWGFYPLVKSTGQWVKFYNSNMMVTATFMFGK